MPKKLRALPACLEPHPATRKLASPGLHEAALLQVHSQRLGQARQAGAQRLVQLHHLLQQLLQQELEGRPPDLHSMADSSSIISTKVAAACKLSMGV